MDAERRLLFGRCAVQQRRRKHDLPIALGLLCLTVVVYICGLAPIPAREVELDHVARNVDLRRDIKMPWKMHDHRNSGRLNDALLLGRAPERIEVFNSTRVFVSVKTTTSLHERRLPLLMLTWMQTIHADQVRQQRELAKVYTVLALLIRVVRKMNVFFEAANYKKN